MKRPIELFDSRLPDRFWAKVSPEPNSGCWLWAARVSSLGYGQTSVNGKTKRAHKVAFEALVSPVPAGLQLDHLCRTRCCVNPNHLEPVTPSENVRRGANVVGVTHCPFGHKYSADNTLIKKGWRNCRTCIRRRNREYVRNKRRLRVAEAPKRTVTIDITDLHAMIATSVRAVLNQRGLVLCSASDTQYPKLGRDLDKVLDECGRNAAGVVALLDESEAA